MKKANLNSNTELLVNNGDFEIIFSESFNLYEDSLSIRNLFGSEMFFKFENSQIENKPKFELNTEQNKFNFKFINFNKNPLGMCTTDITEIGEATPDPNDVTKKKKLFFSVHVKNVSENSNFFIFNLTLYMK